MTRYCWLTRVGPPRPPRAEKRRDRRCSAECSTEQLREGPVPRWSTAPKGGGLRRPGAREGAGRRVGGDTRKAKLPQGTSRAWGRAENRKWEVCGRGLPARGLHKLRARRSGRTWARAVEVLRDSSAAGVRGGVGGRRSASGYRALSEAAREVMLRAPGWAGLRGRRQGAGCGASGYFSGLAELSASGGAAWALGPATPAEAPLLGR